MVRYPMIHAAEQSLSYTLFVAVCDSYMYNLVSDHESAFYPARLTLRTTVYCALQQEMRSMKRRICPIAVIYYAINVLSLTLMG